MSSNTTNNNTADESGLMAFLESLPIDWRILLVLLIVVILGVVAYKKGWIPGLGSKQMVDQP